MTKTGTNGILAAALAYAKTGFRVFPLHSPDGSGVCSCGIKNCRNVGKHPRTRHGFKDATADAQQITRWWQRWPEANIGTPTGQGLVVLDIDPRNGGMESIAKLTEEHEPLPETRQQATGGDGYHFFFEDARSIKSSPGLRPGVDLKAEGGYIVLPPSRHASGNRYYWLKNTKTLPLPAWIHKLQTSENGNNEAKRHQGPTISKGKRNQALLSYAGTMRRRDMEQEEISAALLVMNEKRCDPPLPESEVRGIAASVCRYTPNAAEAAPPRPALVSLDDVQAEPVTFLWPPYLPLQKVTLIEGDPGVGKSWLVFSLSSAVSLGRGLPGGATFDAGRVLILSAEDGLADTIKPRLAALGANTANISALDGALTLDNVGFARLAEAIEEVKPALVTIDPLFAYFGEKRDINQANQTRAVMSRLADLASTHKCAILCVRHLTKGTRSKSIHRGIGSVDLTAAARSVVLVGYDPSTPTLRAMVHIKSNLAPLGPSLGFEIEEGQFNWTGESPLTAERLLADEREDDKLPVEEAEELLKQVLASGPVSAAEIYQDAKLNQISLTTLKRAKKNLKVTSKKLGFDGKGWLWNLPEDGHEGGQGWSPSANGHERVIFPGAIPGGPLREKEDVK